MSRLFLFFSPSKILRALTSTKHFFNYTVKGNWLNIGARRLGPIYESGRLFKFGKRTYIVPTPIGSNISITISSDQQNKQLEVTTSYGEHLPETVEILDFSNEKSQKISIVDSKASAVNIVLKNVSSKRRPLKYQIKYNEQIIKNNLPEVKGMADIHTHQMAEYAFNENWLHGSHTGHPSKALCNCSTYGNEWFEKMWNSRKTGNDSYIRHGDGYPTFNDWPHHLDFAHQQCHENWLKDAFDKGLKLIFASAVNNEVLAIGLGLVKKSKADAPFRDMPSLKKQIREIHAFAEKHDWYEIALNPWHARQIIHNGKMAVVISVESSNIFPASEGDEVDQLDELFEMGVRSVQIVHEIDNKFGGAAPQEKVLDNLMRLKNFVNGKGLSSFNLDEKGLNKQGLTKTGKKMINALIDRNLLVDAAHYSRRTLEDVYDIVKENNYYPLINSHIKFYDILNDEEREIQREFLLHKDQLEYFKKTGGILGLRTAPWPNREHIANVPEEKIVGDKGEIGTARSFAQLIHYAHDNDINIAYGTDINGFTNQLGPRNNEGECPANLDPLYWKKGLHHIGMLPALQDDLEHLNVPGAKALKNSAETFLKTWERCWKEERTEKLLA